MGKKHIKSRQNAGKQAKLIKEPVVSEDIPQEKKKPLFSFQHLDKDYCISCCEKNDKAAFAEQLRVLSQLTWAELRQAPRHGAGYEKIPRRVITGKIPNHLQNDDVSFLVFRFSGTKAMVGYREREIFHVIWLDRNYTLYPH